MSLYLTAILPPTHLSTEIDEIRIELSERFKIYAALKPPVHITLFRPVNYQEELENHLIKLLKSVGPKHEPFTQQLLNFDSFNIQTIFINAVKNTALNLLKRDITAVFNKNKIDPKEVKGNTTFHPHITIGYRDIPPETFPLIWEELKNRKFKREFQINHFTLLKHDGKRWQILEEFPLHKPKVLELF